MWDLITMDGRRILHEGLFGEFMFLVDRGKCRVLMAAFGQEFHRLKGRKSSNVW